MSTNFRANKFWVLNKFGSNVVKIRLVLAEIYHYNETKILGPINFGSKINLGQGLVKIRLVLAEIYHFIETRTNIAGNNKYRSPNQLAIKVWLSSDQ